MSAFSERESFTGGGNARNCQSASGNAYPFSKTPKGDWAVVQSPILETNISLASLVR